MTLSFTDTLDIERRRLDILAPHNFPNFVQTYFGFPMGTMHREWFQKYYFDESIKRLLLEAPMEHAKTTYCSVIYPIWRICNNKRWTGILAGSSLDLPIESLLKIQNHLLQNERLIRDFGPFLARGHKKTERMFFVLGSDPYGPPTMRAAAVGAKIAGKRAWELLGDDLLDLLNTSTPRQREKVKYWFQMQFLTRVHPDGIVRVIGNDYGEYCLYQDIIEKREGQFQDWSTVVYQAISKANSGPQGEAWVEFWPYAKLMALLNEIGSHAFELAMQNNPKAVTGRVFKKFQFYRDAPKGLEVFQGVDLAISEEETADYFVIITIGVKPDTQDIFVLDVFRDRLSYTKQVDAIQREAAAWRPLGIAISAVAYEAAMSQNLTAITMLPVKKFPPKGQRAIPKHHLILALNVLFENGKVWLREGQGELLRELKDYHEHIGKSPDQIDALVYATNLARTQMATRFLAGIESDDRQGRLSLPSWGGRKVGNGRH